MRKKQIFTLILTIFTSLVYGQSKKELNETISKLRLDSTALKLAIKDNNLIIDSLKKEISDYQESSTVLNNKNKIHLKELQKNEALLKNTKTENTLLQDSIENLQKSVDSGNTLNALLQDSIEDLQKSADSANTLSHITRFVQTFYNSLELSEAENLRQYEVGDVRFDLDNFYCLIGENAKYSQKRVQNVSDENYHDRYYVELLSIEDINFVNNKIIVSTKVLYAGQEMGSFYNGEQLTLQDNKGLLKLTSWLDVDLYKMEPSEYEHMANFSKDDFYQWLGSYNKN